MQIKCFCGKIIEYEKNNYGPIINHYITYPHILYNDNFINDEELTKLIIETGCYKFFNIAGDLSFFNSLLKKYEDEQNEGKKNARIRQILLLLRLLFKPNDLKLL